MAIVKVEIEKKNQFLNLIEFYNNKRDVITNQILDIINRLCKKKKSAKVVNFRVPTYIDITNCRMED